MSAGVSSGPKKTGTIKEASFPEFGFCRSARPIACTISTEDPFGSKSATESTAGQSTPSPSTRQFDKTARRAVPPNSVSTVAR